MPRHHAEEYVLKQTAAPIKKTHMFTFGYRFKMVNGACVVSLSWGKPCKSCAQLMSDAGIKRCTYSTPTAFVTQPMTAILHEALYSRGTLIPKVWCDRSLLQTALLRPMFELFIRAETTFERIRTGVKTIEGRLWNGAIRTLHIGDVVWVVWQGKRIPVQITFMRRYASFHAMLSFRDTFKKTLDEPSILSGVEKYNAMFPKKKRSGKQVLAIGLRVLMLTC